MWRLNLAGVFIDFKDIPLSKEGRVKWCGESNLISLGLLDWLTVPLGGWIVLELLFKIPFSLIKCIWFGICYKFIAVVELIVLGLTSSLLLLFKLLTELIYLRETLDLSWIKHNLSNLLRKKTNP